MIIIILTGQYYQLKSNILNEYKLFSIWLIFRKPFPSENNYKPILDFYLSTLNKNCERFGVGRSMLRKIFTISITLSHYVGCRIITVDSKHSAVDFYKKFAFKQAIRTLGETVPLYLDLKSALQRILPDSWFSFLEVTWTLHVHTDHDKKWWRFLVGDEI